MCDRVNSGGKKLLIVLLSVARVRISGTNYRMISQGVLSAETEGAARQYWSAEQCWGRGRQSR